MVAAIVVGITSNSGKYGNNKNVSNGADNEFYKIRINDMEGNVIHVLAGCIVAEINHAGVIGINHSV